MSWVTTFFTSSIGRKLIMSLTGLFLIIFLFVHLIGNLQLLYGDGGQAFNIYAKFMTTNPFITFTSYGLYAGILLHAIQGIILWRKNATSRPQKYAVASKSTSSYASRNMGWLGVIIFIFLVIHMAQFWFKMKFGDYSWFPTSIESVPKVMYDGVQVKNLYYTVSQAYANPFFVIFYVLSMAVMGVHLYHGFGSAFQTLGLNHKKYTPFINMLGKGYSILIPLGFAIIPIYMFFTLTR